MAPDVLKRDALSLPNLLTYGRIAAVPVIVAAIVMDGAAGSWIAFVLFVAAAVTDYLDGWMARRYKQQSALGAMLDPIADKLVVAGTLFALAAVGTISGWAIAAALIILCREILVSGLREYLAGLQVSVPVTWLAKWKTTLQLVAIGALIIAPALEMLAPGMVLAALAALWISAVLTLYTGVEYFRAGIGHLGRVDA